MKPSQSPDQDKYKFSTDSTQACEEARVGGVPTRSPVPTLRGANERSPQPAPAYGDEWTTPLGAHVLVVGHPVTDRRGRTRVRALRTYGDRVVEIEPDVEVMRTYWRRVRPGARSVA